MNVTSTTDVINCKGIICTVCGVSGTITDYLHWYAVGDKVLPSVMSTKSLFYLSCYNTDFCYSKPASRTAAGLILRRPVTSIEVVIARETQKHKSLKHRLL